jgi:hypothetical protein
LVSGAVVRVFATSALVHISAMVSARATLKWEPDTPQAEVWTPQDAQDETWTPTSATGATWTQAA